MPAKMSAGKTTVSAAFADVAWEGQARSMVRRTLAEGLLDAVFDAFGPVLPDGVFLVKEGSHHHAESRDGAMVGGVVTTSTPPFPMSDDKALELGLHAYAETLRHFVSEVVDQPWPERGAKTRVSATGGIWIWIWFGPKSRQHAVLALPAIAWTGPVFDTAPAPAPESEPAPRFAGTLTDKQRAEKTKMYEHLGREAEAAQQATAAAFAAARARAPGLTPEQMRTVVHEEFTAHGKELPPGVEEYIAEMLAAPHNPHPAANSAKATGKAAIRTVHWLRTKPGNAETTYEE